MSLSEFLYSGARRNGTDQSRLFRRCRKDRSPMMYKDYSWPEGCSYVFSCSYVSFTSGVDPAVLGLQGPQRRSVQLTGSTDGKLNRWGSCRQVRFPTNGNKFEGWGSCTTSSKSLCILFENVDLSYSGIRAQSLGQGPGICILTSLSYTPVFGNFWSGYCFHLARSHGNF